VIFVAEPFRETFRQLGITAEGIFTNPAIRAWRVLDDRENCTWDLPRGSETVRLHLKRFPRWRGKSPAELEAEGYRMLGERGIATASVATWGTLDDGRSFIATVDLDGFAPADKLLETGLQFDRLMNETAAMAAKLHSSGLHHRDLYLCHFLARCPNGDAAELRLIDAARVRPLPGPLTRRRWIVKDLAQFWYSTLALNVTDAQRDQWLRKYCGDAEAADALKRAIMRKSAAIQAHDARLRRRQPHRNISIPKN
jgi:hypothetical protein